MATTSKRNIEIHTTIGVRVDRYDVDINTSLHWDLNTNRPYSSRDTDPVYPSHTSLVLTGAATYPAERAAERFEITVVGDTSTEPPPTLRDARALDENRVPRYKAYRGVEYPVYEIFKGLAMLRRARGEPDWTAWLRVAPSSVSDMLSALALQRQFYISIHEKKSGRERWIQSLSLQTVDPALE